MKLISIVIILRKKGDQKWTKTLLNLWKQINQKQLCSFRTCWAASNSTEDTTLISCTPSTWGFPGLCWFWSVSPEMWHVGVLLRKPRWASCWMGRRRLLLNILIASLWLWVKGLQRAFLISSYSLKACQSVLPCQWVKGLMHNPILHLLSPLFCCHFYFSLRLYNFKIILYIFDFFYFP